MNQERQNPQSTKDTSINDTAVVWIKNKLAELQVRRQPVQSLEEVLRLDINDEKIPASTSPNIKCNSVAYAIINKMKY